MAKVLFLLLGVFLLAQYCATRSVGSVDNATDIDGRESLEYYAVMQFKHMAMSTISNGKKWLQRAQDEIDTIARKNEKTRELSESIAEYLEKIRQMRRNHDEGSKFLKMSEIFENILDLSTKYDLSEVKNPDPELKSLADLLTRNGMDVFDNLFFQDFMNCAEKIVSATERYVSSLSPTQRRKETNLINWLNEFKTEEDLAKKFDIFSKFFDLSED